MTYWKDKLLIGVPQIDDQHRKLISAIDALMDACAKGQGRVTIASTLAFALAYAKEHFADEEKLQARVGYPGIAAHKRLHIQYIASVTALSDELERDGPSVALVGKLNKTLVEWLTRHISTEDQKIAAHIKSEHAQ